MVILIKCVSLGTAKLQGSFAVPLRWIFLMNSFSINQTNKTVPSEMELRGWRDG